MDSTRYNLCFNENHVLLKATELLDTEEEEDDEWGMEIKIQMQLWDVKKYGRFKLSICYSLFSYFF